MNTIPRERRPETRKTFLAFVRSSSLAQQGFACSTRLSSAAGKRLVTQCKNSAPGKAANCYAVGCFPR